MNVKSSTRPLIVQENTNKNVWVGRCLMWGSVYGQNTLFYCSEIFVLINVAKELFVRLHKDSEKLIMIPGIVFV